MKLLVKFGKKKYLQQSIAVSLFSFSTALSFKKIETESHIKGQGDDAEATLKLPVTSAAIYDDSGKKDVFQHPDLVSALILAVANTPVYCLSEIDSDIDCIQTENGAIIKSEFMRTIRSHFPKADSALIFHDKNDFIQSVLDQFPAAKMGRVNYYESCSDGITTQYMSNIGNRVSEKEFLEQLGNCCFCYVEESKLGGEREYYLVYDEDAYQCLFIKDNYFSGEKEFRVVLPDKSNPLPRMNYWLKTIDRTKLELLSLDEFENTILFHPFL